MKLTKNQIHKRLKKRVFFKFFFHQEFFKKIKWVRNLNFFQICDTFCIFKKKIIICIFIKISFLIIFLQKEDYFFYFFIKFLKKASNLDF